MLSLVVYAIGSRLKHIFRREICSIDPVPSKVCQSLYQDGHEYITSCLSLLYHCLLEAWGRTSNHALPMDKKYKLSYDPPKVAVVAFKVENGLQTSRIVDMGSVFTPFDDATWDNPSSSTATGLFGDGDWTGGSSFSSNSSFGSSSWDN